MPKILLIILFIIMIRSRYYVIRYVKLTILDTDYLYEKYLIIFY